MHIILHDGIQEVLESEDANLGWRKEAQAEEARSGAMYTNSKRQA